MFKIQCSTTGWIPVERNILIDYDLENSPLEIKTDSALRSNDRVAVYFYESTGNTAARIVQFIFTATPKYAISYCSHSWTKFPTTLPSATDKVWRLTLTRTSGIRLQIHCNDVEVLNLLMSDSTCRYPYHTDWSKYWTKDVAKIKFSSSDGASDFYTAKQGD